LIIYEFLKGVVMKKMYLFGAGTNGYAVIKFFGDVFINVVDNDLSKIGTFFCGYKVVSFEEFLKQYEGEKVIISAYSKSEDIVEQLVSHNILDYYISPLMQYGFWENCLEIVNKHNMMNMPAITLVGDNPFTQLIVEELNSQGYKGLISVLQKESVDVDKLDGNVFVTDSLLYDKMLCGMGVDLTKQRIVYKNELEGFKNIHKGNRCFEVVNITLHFSYTKFPKQPYPSLNHSTSFS